MFELLKALALSVLTVQQAENLNVGCWLKAVDSSTVTVACGLAYDGKVVNVVSSQPLSVKDGVQSEALAGAWCAGIHALLEPPKETPTSVD
jgi:hypothetical protein